MALKTQDYYMLVELRKNLFAMQEAKKQAAKGREKLDHLRSTLSDIQNTDKYMAKEPEYSLHEKAAEQEFEREHRRKVDPINRKLHEENVKKSGAVKFLLGVLFTIVTAAGIVGLIYLIAFLWDKTQLGYGFFVANQWVGVDAIAPSWSGSIHIYCFVLGALAALMFASAIITAIADGEVSLTFSVFGIIMLVFAYVAGFVFIGQWWNVSAGWWILAWIPAVLVATFLPIIFVVKIVYATVVAFVLLAILAVIPVICFLLWYFFDSVCEALSPKRKYVSERINVDEFHQTAEYRRAVELDKKEDAVKRSEHKQKVAIVRNVLATQFKTLITAEEQVISVFNGVAKDCERAIAQCPINAVYKTIENVNWLLYYFEYDLAKTVQEAANLMRNDIQMKQLQDLLQQQHREVMGGFQKIHAQLNQIERTNQALLTQWKVIEQQSRRQHEAMMSKMQHMEEQQERLSSYSLQAIRDAESSISGNIREMQTAYANQSYASANKIANEISVASTTISNSIWALGQG
ncbi:MAG: hypothetical protein E7620_06895 [Ruminococcaceae bacterium]|nr:hypothetical protein [Oscillospiraceae bacterium]